VSSTAQPGARASSQKITSEREIEDRLRRGDSAGAHARPSGPGPSTGASGIGFTVSRIARAVAVTPIVVYQRVLSPLLPRRCKYEPTCSHYAVDAIREYGILRGAVLALWRLLRCNPWSYGGYDPVEDQRLFAVGVGGSRSGRAHGT
jgi:putative membrane protein insertion efficiency factor